MQTLEIYYGFVQLEILERLEIVDNDSCTKWNGKFNSWGYPMLGDRLVSRIIYRELFGPIDRKTLILHTCDNPECLNPYHLKAGTPKENMQDMARKGRSGMTKERRANRGTP